jgi:hypothetical protein
MFDQWDANAVREPFAIRQVLPSLGCFSPVGEPKGAQDH